MPGVDILATAFNGANAAFIADLYARWVRDPASVDQSFAGLFEALNDEARSVLTDASGASWAPRHWEIEADGPAPAPAAKKAPMPNGAAGNGAAAPVVAKSAPAASAPTSPGTPMSRAEASALAHEDTINSIRALMLIRAYRMRGHLEAKLDPLGQQVPRHHPELDPATYGFTPADYDKPIFIDNMLGRETATLREILRVLQESYCGTLGIEFMHIQDTAQKAWLQRRIEGATWRREIDKATKTQLLQELTEAEAF